jgi:hypothetical protein
MSHGENSYATAVWYYSYNYEDGCWLRKLPHQPELQQHCCYLVVARARSAAAAGLLVIVERDIICIFSPNGGDFSPAFPFRACHLSGMHNFVPFFFISVLQFQLNFFKQYARRRGICSFKMAHCTDIIKVFVSIFGCFFLAKANPSFVVPYSGHTELVFHAEHVGNVL